MLATTFRYVLYARQGLTDAPVTAFITISIWAFLKAHDATEGDGRRYAWLAWAGVGCAALTKGPVAVFAPTIWIVFAWLTSGRRGIRRMHLPSGLLIASAIALPWNLAMWAMHGNAFLETALRQEVIVRYLSEDFQHRGFFYFFGAWIGDGAPWSFFFLPALAWIGLNRRRLHAGVVRAGLLTGVWFATVLLVFSCSAYKLPHYILPAYPAMALAV